MMDAGPADVRPPRLHRRGSVNSVKLGNSTKELRTRVTIDDGGVQRLRLALWDAGQGVAELSLSFRELPAFRAAVNAAIKQALQQRPPAMPAGGTPTTTDPDDQE